MATTKQHRSHNDDLDNLGAQCMSVRLTPSAHPWPSFCRSEGPVGWGTHFHVDCRTSCFVRSTALTIGGSVPTRPTKWDSRGQRRVLKFPLQQDSDTVSLCAHSNARAAKPSTHNTKETQKQDTKKSGQRSNTSSQRLLHRDDHSTSSLACDNA